MKRQQRREAQTVAIGTALSVTLAVFAIGIAGVAVVGVMTDMSRAFSTALNWVAVGAFAAGLGYLIRNNQ